MNKSYWNIITVLIIGIFFFQCKTKDSKSDEKVRESIERKKETDLPRIEIYEEEGKKLISSNAEIEELGSGFKWTEGPVYVESEDFLLFSDIPENKIMKWSKEKGIELFLEPAGYTGVIKREGEPGSNGLLINANNQLVLCQHGDRRMAILNSSWSNPSPTFTTLIDKYNGKRLNSPNDAVFHSNGDLYFTDPPYGLSKGMEDKQKELPFQGVYRLKPSGDIDLLTKELRYPNGIQFSPDEKTLYVANSDHENFIWMAYDVKENGMIDNGRVFYDANPYKEKWPGAPDGLKVNKEGYIFASAPGGVWIFNPAGKVLARIFTGQRTSNCALSPNEDYLFMTADDYLLGVKLI